MLASLEDLDDYGVTPRPEILAQVRFSSTCSLCGAEPLSASASYTETLGWLRRNHSPAVIEMESMSAAEPAGERNSSSGWLELRKTQSYDSQLSPGYATSVVSLANAMGLLHPDQQDFFANVFLAARCDICAHRSDESEDSLLLSYVNQWADGNIDVARRQPTWPEIESIASIVRSAARSSFRRA